MKNKTNIDEWSYFHLGVSVLGYAGDEASNIHEKENNKENIIKLFHAFCA